MQWLAVLYDDECGICSRVRRWLEKQPTFVPLRLIPLHSFETMAAFPGIESFSPEEKLVVIADDGSVWRGDGAWIMLLWTLESGRELSMKLASPSLRPFARKVVTAVSANRLKLSGWLRLRPERLAKHEVCNTATCQVPSSTTPRRVVPPVLPR
jgi:predicted DCC family thiol-disulfide oxidoreductase YuxK